MHGSGVVAALPVSDLMFPEAVACRAIAGVSPARAVVAGRAGGLVHVLDGLRNAGELRLRSLGRRRVDEVVALATAAAAAEGISPRLGLASSAPSV